MTFYLLVWMGYSCPWIFGWAVPAKARPLVCTQTLEHRYTSHRREAEMYLKDLDPGTPAMLLELRGGRSRVIKHEWLRPEVTIGQ